MNQPQDLRNPFGADVPAVSRRDGTRKPAARQCFLAGTMPREAFRRARSRRDQSERRGTIIIIFSVVLIVVMGLLALSIDLGYVCSVKADMQRAVDAGALAGGGSIAESPNAVEDAARRFTEMNLERSVSRNTGSGLDVDVATGHWDSNSRQFEPGGFPRDAVKVTAEIQNVSLFFGRAAGRQSFASKTSAIAAFRSRDIMLVLDVSGSMDESRRGVKKIDELRDSVQIMLRHLRATRAHDRVGFTYYSTSAGLGSGMVADLDQVERAAMNRLRPDGYTNIADGMQLALNEFQANRRAYASPLMVLLTDGAANMNQPGDRYDPTEAKSRVLRRAEDSRQAGIPIVAIALDSGNSEVDVALMQQVGSITGSSSHHILCGEDADTGGTELEELFRRVAAARPLRLVE